MVHRRLHSRGHGGNRRPEISDGNDPRPVGIGHSRQRHEEETSYRSPRNDRSGTAGARGLISGDGSRAAWLSLPTGGVHSSARTWYIASLAPGGSTNNWTYPAHLGWRATSAAMQVGWRLAAAVERFWLSTSLAAERASRTVTPPARRCEWRSPQMAPESRQILNMVL